MTSDTEFEAAFLEETLLLNFKLCVVFSVLLCGPRGQCTLGTE